MLNPGDKAPEFELPDADMHMVSSDAFAGRRYVIYFYPKDDTPGCTLEAQEFTDMMAEFAARDTSLIGVSRDTCASHGAFRDKYGIDVTLLADVEGQVCEAYGVWQEKDRALHLCGRWRRPDPLCGVRRHTQGACGKDPGGRALTLRPAWPSRMPGTTAAIPAPARPPGTASRPSRGDRNTAAGR